MRISFDSNVWEVIFGSDAREIVLVRAALADGQIEGFICEAAFRIEAVRKNDRPAYFARPQMEVTFPSRVVSIEGKPYIHYMSMSPDDGRHPGLPEIQAKRLEAALSAGLRLMRGLAWIRGCHHPQKLVIRESLSNRQKAREATESSVKAPLVQKSGSVELASKRSTRPEDGKLSSKARFMKRSFRRLVPNGLMES